MVKKRITKLVDAFANLHSSYIMEVFDYIVVGAGSARCILATRLTERSNFTIVLNVGPWELQSAHPYPCGLDGTDGQI